MTTIHTRDNARATCAGDCGRPSPTSVLCEECWILLGDLLDQTPWMLEQLRISSIRQARLTRNVGPRSHDQPLAFHEPASRHYQRLSGIVTSHQATAADHVGQPVRHPRPSRAAEWLSDHLDRLHTWTPAGSLLAALTRAADRTEQIINRPVQPDYLGDCPGGTTDDGVDIPCTGELYAQPADADAECDTCGRTFNAGAQRQRLLDWMDGRLMTAAEIAKASTFMDLTVGREHVRKMVNKWASRKRITQAGHSLEGDPTFQFAPVRRLLEESYTRDSERSTDTSTQGVSPLRRSGRPLPETG